MTRLTKRDKALITDLVVAYQCFNEANHRDFGTERDVGISVWGNILLAAQDGLGLEMIERQMLVEFLANANERHEQRDREAAAKEQKIEAHDRAEYELEQRT